MMRPWVENLDVILLSVYYCGTLMSAAVLMEAKVYRQRWGRLFVAGAIIAWPLTWISFVVFWLQRSTQIETGSVQPRALHEFVTRAIDSFKARM